MHSLIVEFKVLYVSIASNFLTVCLNLLNCADFLFLSFTYWMKCLDISHYYWSLAMAFSNHLHFPWYIWDNISTYIWIWNYHIFQLNYFYCFVGTFLFKCTFFVFIWVSHSFLYIIFFHPITFSFMCHCSLVLAESIESNEQICPLADIYSLCI